MYKSKYIFNNFNSEDLGRLLNLDEEKTKQLVEHVKCETPIQYPRLTRQVRKLWASKIPSNLDTGGLSDMLR